MADDPHIEHERKLLGMVNRACQLGDEQSALICEQNNKIRLLLNEIRMLRGVLWQALALLRTGRIDVARNVLEKKVVKRS